MKHWLRCRGLSLIETCVTGAIVAVIVGAAVPSFNASVDRHATEGAVDEFKSDAELARSFAVSRASAVNIHFQTTPAGSCYIVHTGNVGACECDEHGRAKCAGAADVLRTVMLPAAGRVQFRSNVAAIRFNPHNGTVTPAGSITFTGRHGAALRAIVGSMGRTRACTPNASIPGRPSCN